MENKKKKLKWQKYITMFFSLLMGAVSGWIITKYSISSTDNMIELLLIVLGAYVAMIMQIIIHEAGHLVFGLATGYKFSSFRIMSFMWKKEDGKIKLKRYSLAGTGGQCLMAPPEMVDGKMPYILYNFGGAIFNLVSAIIFLILYFVFRESNVVSVVMMLSAMLGFLSALSNGIPMPTGTVDNDARNAISMSKSPEAVRSMWIQLKVSELMAQGIRLKNMPAEWFKVPDDEGLQNNMTSVMAVFGCNRLMDELRFDEADKLMKNLLEKDTAIAGIHRNLLICDRMYCEMISTNRKDMVDAMLTKEQNKFMRSMKKFLTVIRTEFTYALLAERNIQKAEKIRLEFEKNAEKYPYPSDVESEREFIKIAIDKFNNV